MGSLCTTYMIQMRWDGMDKWDCLCPDGDMRDVPWNPGVPYRTDGMAHVGLADSSMESALCPMGSQYITCCVLEGHPWGSNHPNGTNGIPSGHSLALLDITLTLLWHM